MDEETFREAELRLRECYEADGTAAENRFADFWLLVAAWVRGLAWLLLGRWPQRNRDDRADEVAQCVGVQVWFTHSNPNARWRAEKGALRSWLSTLVSHTISNLYRDDLRFRAQLFSQLAAHGEGGIESAVPARSGTPADDVALADVLDSFLRELSEPDRTLFEMKMFEALTQGAIAERLGMSGPTVSRRLSEMEAELRDRLGLPRR